MATDILSIPQIAVPDLANIQNDLHIGLGGQPVQPSDEIDVDKEYELIPIE